MGADGRHSGIARQVHAEEYLGYDAPRAMYLGILERARILANRFRLSIRDVFREYRWSRSRDLSDDHDQLLIGSLPQVEEAMSWRTDVDAALIADLASDLITGPLIARPMDASLGP